MTCGSSDKDFKCISLASKLDPLTSTHESTKKSKQTHTHKHKKEEKSAINYLNREDKDDDQEEADRCCCRHPNSLCCACG